ncbi:hypothetical protein TrVFT333_011100 [Trichoderma virens FT-333]|nr:hypothetical protein TrVFT333_011100 [Trichoderma virens FT-333]
MRATQQAVRGEGQTLGRWSHHKKSQTTPHNHSPRSCRLQFWRRARASQVPPPGGPQARNFLAIIGHTTSLPMGGRATFGLTRLPGGAPKKSARHVTRAAGIHRARQSNGRCWLVGPERLKGKDNDETYL